jgi:hypothetical protein
MTKSLQKLNQLENSNSFLLKRYRETNQLKYFLKANHIYKEIIAIKEGNQKIAPAR